jgi:hypothetical protein
VRTDQGEAILMLFDVPNRDFPPLDCVAVFALGSQLPSVNIGVAIGAAVAHIGKNKVRMTLRAVDQRGVHAAQWVCSFVVIKIRPRANRFPTRAGVT